MTWHSRSRSQLTTQPQTCSGRQRRHLVWTQLLHGPLDHDQRVDRCAAVHAVFQRSLASVVVFIYRGFLCRPDGLLVRSFGPLQFSVRKRSTHPPACGFPAKLGAWRISCRPCGRRAGSEAAARLAQRLDGAGLRSTIVRTARTGTDMADLVHGCALSGKRLGAP
ncbi:MAG: hypothetical protein JWQ13_1403 [Ramlibacter sp.]|nr:hypothetical protein [Ramlibacter sp.]